MADTAMQPALSIGDALPWVRMTLDYTDRLAGSIPENLLDWRSPDPSGAFSFSLGEIAAHTADARRMFVATLTGEKDESAYWSSGPKEPDYKLWEFRSFTLPEVIESLAASRALVEEWLARPASGMLEATDGTRESWEKMKAKLTEDGQAEELVKAELRGPATVLRIMMALAVHEAGHRGSLQTLLRQHGVATGTE
jgi:uncharacterized damage-inducible protein DinB